MESLAAAFDVKPAMYPINRLWYHLVLVLRRSLHLVLCTVESPHHENSSDLYFVHRMQLTI